MSGMSYNWEAIESVSTTLDQSYSTLKTQLEIIDSTVTKMGNSWSGEAWTAFKKYYDNYKSGTLDPLSSEIGTWVSNLKTLSENAKSTQTSNTSLFGGSE